MGSKIEKYQFFFLHLVLDLISYKDKLLYGKQADFAISNPPENTFFHHLL